MWFMDVARMMPAAADYEKEMEGSRRQKGGGETITAKLAMQGIRWLDGSVLQSCSCVATSARQVSRRAQPATAGGLAQRGGCRARHLVADESSVRAAVQIHELRYSKGRACGQEPSANAADGRRPQRQQLFKQAAVQLTRGNHRPCTPPHATPAPECGRG